MNRFKLVATLLFFTLITACNHPIEIVGEGDVVSSTGSRSCSLEDFKAGKDNCKKNTVVGAYKETYTAAPRSGWTFQGWEGTCSAFGAGKCTFDVAGGTVSANWGKTMPSMVAVFRPEVTGSTAKWLYVGGDQSDIYKVNPTTGDVAAHFRWQWDKTLDGGFQSGLGDMVFVGDQAFAIDDESQTSHIYRVQLNEPFFSTQLVFDMKKAFPTSKPLTREILDDYWAEFISLVAHDGVLYGQISHGETQKLLPIDPVTMTVIRDAVEIHWAEDEFDWNISAMAFNDAGQLYAVGVQRDIAGASHYLMWLIDPVTGQMTKVREFTQTVHEYITFLSFHAMTFTNVGLIAFKKFGHFHEFDLDSGTIIDRAEGKFALVSNPFITSK